MGDGSNKINPYVISKVLLGASGRMRISKIIFVSTRPQTIWSETSNQSCPQPLYKAHQFTLYFVVRIGAPATSCFQATSAAGQLPAEQHPPAQSPPWQPAPKFSLQRQGTLNSKSSGPIPRLQPISLIRDRVPSTSNYAFNFHLTKGCYGRVGGS